MSNTDNTNNNSIDNKKKKTSTTKKSTKKKEINDEDRPLTVLEEKFIAKFIQHGNATLAYKEAGYKDYTSERSLYVKAFNLKNKPKIKKKIQQLRKQYFEEQMATGEEVMAYLAAVVRGEIKDQFGLDASISERTRAALEIAKRTVDLDLIKETRSQQTTDNTIKIQFDWSRDNGNKEN